MDLDTPLNCLTFNLLRAARSLTRRFDAAMAEVDLTAQQFSALALLSGPEAIPLSRLAEQMGAERTTVTRNIAVLRKKGLVDAAPADDARITALQLTQAGQRRLSEALPVWRAFQKQALGGVKGTTPQALIATLKGL